MLDRDVRYDGIVEQQELGRNNYNIIKQILHMHIYTGIKSMGTSSDGMRRASMCGFSPFVSLDQKQNRNLERVINLDTKNK
jgi:hypothetical protein